MLFTILWIIGITLLIALWVGLADFVPQFLGPVYFALPFFSLFIVWLFVKVFKK
jgi:hypothetical protein